MNLPIFNCASPMDSMSSKGERSTVVHRTMWVTDSHSGVQTSAIEHLTWNTRNIKIADNATIGFEKPVTDGFSVLSLNKAEIQRSIAVVGTTSATLPTRYSVAIHTVNIGCGRIVVWYHSRPCVIIPRFTSKPIGLHQNRFERSLNMD